MKTFAATAIASSALLSLASGQSVYQIDPNSVSESTRTFWCNSQITQCPVSIMVRSSQEILLTRVTVDLPAAPV
jgi:hypothetical protein